MIENKNYFPTPDFIIEKMILKLKYKHRTKYILEPSAGSGNIIDHLKKWNHRFTIHAIESDQKLQSILKEKCQLIGHDFLTFNGPDKYDLIIANPPFDKGAEHLLKAIDIMYSGEIVFLLNAETLKNPYSKIRKVLKEKLNKLNANIEFIKHPFLFAERKTKVEIALVYIKIERKIEDDLFDGTNNKDINVYLGAEPEQKEITQKDSIRNQVADYERTLKIGTETLLNFYKNYYHISPFMNILIGKEYESSHNSLTDTMKLKLNEFIKELRKTYWRKILDFEKVKERMTIKKIDEFNVHLQQNEYMDFTEKNIHIFIMNLINNYENILIDAVLEIFDKMTINNAWHEDLHTKNIHYFNGWKTNKAYYVNKKVILPFYSSYGGAFYDTCFNRWKLDYKVKEQFNDIDKIAHYFSGRSEYYSIADSVSKAMEQGKTKNIESTYFFITVFKKGTAHFTFKDEDVLRRFNITACKGKNWLPEDYGRKEYNKMDKEEKKVVESFEEKKIYIKNTIDSKNLFQMKSLLQIEPPDYS